MKKNMGRTDRIIRIVLGIVLVLLGLVVVFPSDFLAWLVVILGAILLVTGIVGFCPIYVLLKTNTLNK